MGPKALQFIQAVARKLLAKPTKPSEGIITIGNRMQAEAKAGEIAETFRASGLTIDKWDDFIKSEKDVLKFLNIIESSKPKGPTILGHRVIDATSAEGKGITEALLGKKSADVLDLTGKKIDTSKPILGGKNVPEIDIVTETIAVIKSKKPIDAMKEANSVIGRKGKYKNLTEEQSQKILKDTNDHIFERDIKYDEFGEIIKPDPEDLAQGGRTGFKFGTDTGQTFYDDEDEDEYSDIEGHTAGLGVASFLSKKFGPKLGAYLFKTGKNKALKEIGKKVKPILPGVLTGGQAQGAGGYTGPQTQDFNPQQFAKSGGQRPDKPGGFTDPGKGSYGPHMAYGGRVSYFDGGLLSLWPR